MKKDCGLLFNHPLTLIHKGMRTRAISGRIREGVPELQQITDLEPIGKPFRTRMAKGAIVLAGLSRAGRHGVNQCFRVFSALQGAVW